jgi:hypothetical protein
MFRWVLTCTYHCYQVTHVASDGSIDFFIRRRFYDDSDVLRLCQ